MSWALCERKKTEEQYSDVISKQSMQYCNEKCLVLSVDFGGCDKIRFVKGPLSPELKMPRFDLLDIVVVLGGLQSSDHRVEGEELLGDVDVLHHHKPWLA